MAESRRAVSDGDTLVDVSGPGAWQADHRVTAATSTQALLT
jgi:hypothetical protein